MSTIDSLETKKPLETYKDLLQMANANNGVTSALRNIYDGAGNPLPIRVSNNQVWTDADTYVDSSTLNGCSFSPKVGAFINLSDPTFNGTSISWGNADASTFGKQYRKIQQITAASGSILLKPDISTDFIVLNITGSVSGFVVGSYVGYKSDTSFGREIHMLIIPNGFNIEMVPSLPLIWNTKDRSTGNSGSPQYPSTSKSTFGTGNDPCLVRFVHFSSVTVGSKGPDPVWIGSIIGGPLQSPNYG